MVCCREALSAVFLRAKDSGGFFSRFFRFCRAILKQYLKNGYAGKVRSTISGKRAKKYFPQVAESIFDKLLLVVGFIFFFFGLALVVIFITDLVVVAFVPFFAAREEYAQNEHGRRDDENDRQNEIIGQCERGDET